MTGKKRQPIEKENVIEGTLPQICALPTPHTRSVLAVYPFKQNGCAVFFHPAPHFSDCFFKKLSV